MLELCQRCDIQCHAQRLIRVHRFQAQRAQCAKVRQLARHMAHATCLHDEVAQAAEEGQLGWLGQVAGQRDSLPTTLLLLFLHMPEDIASRCSETPSEVTVHLAKPGSMRSGIGLHDD